MVVCLVLEEYEPLFLYSVHNYRNNYRASIDLVWHFHIIELACCLELFHTHKGYIHETYKLVISVLVHLLHLCSVCVKCLLKKILVISIVELYICELCWECCMTAVIWPVCIENSDLGHGWISLLLTLEIVLDVKEILECHGKSKWVIKLLKICLCHVLESVKYMNIGWLRELCNQSLRNLHTAYSWINRVYTVVHDSLHLLVCHVARKYICCGSLDNRLLILCKKLYTLLCWIGSLIELTWKRLYWEHLICGSKLRLTLIDHIYRRLSKYCLKSLCICLIWYVLNIIPDKHSHILSLDTQIVLNLFVKFLRLDRIVRLFLNIHSLDLTHVIPP